MRRFGDVELGRLLAARRVYIGLSQRELAQRVETSASYISQIERAWRAPGRALLARILDVLRLPREAA